MLYQSFSESALKRTLRPSDFFGDGSFRTIDDLEPVVSRAVDIANSESPSFSSLRRITIKRKPALKVGALHDEIILRKLNDTLKRVFKTKQANRDYICRNTKSLLDETLRYAVIKCDISDFFESIPRDQLEAKVLQNRIFSPETKRVFSSLFSANDMKNRSGLPRGLSISGTLAEKYLEDFDKTIKRIPQVYFYARFVDDIIIFVSSDEFAVLDKVRTRLRKLSLSINEGKTAIYANEKEGDIVGRHTKIPDFEFLGYHFEKQGFQKRASVSIAESKLKKIKSRIVYTFIDYAEKGDPKLLEDRVKFLTGNYFILHHSASTPLRAGIFYAYPLATDSGDQLKQLDQFLKAQIFAGKNIPMRRGRPLLEGLKEQLGKYSFLAGYEDRKLANFSQNRIAEIKLAWRNV